VLKSLKSKGVSITTPILVSLFAFRMARSWLAAVQEDSSNDSDLPTPLQ
jgi:hypothetical protein